MADEDMPVFVFGCMSCGKTVSGKEKSCPRCGASFESVVFQCPFCGEPVSPSQLRCESCGTEFGSFAEDVSETAAVSLDGGDRSHEMPTHEAAPLEESVEYECPSCGKPVSENDSECPHCGAKFS
jgi:DNA-directed RNA polymerase subunit RPC12/RpoP